MNTKICDLCSEQYDLASPECPSCIARREWEEKQNKFSHLCRAARNALCELSILPKHLGAPDPESSIEELAMLIASHRKARDELEAALELFNKSK